MRRLVPAVLVVLAIVALAVWGTPPREEGPGDPRPGPAADPEAPPPLPEPPPEIPPGAVLTGIVVDEAGGPIAGARVASESIPWRKIKPLSRATPGPETVSGEDGRFALGLSEFARIDLRVSAEGFAERLLLERRAGDEVRVVLTAGAVLEVVVTDEGGSAVAGAHVYLVRRVAAGDGAIEQRLRTAEDGRVEFRAAPGPRMIAVWADGLGTPQPQMIEIRAGGRSLVEFVLPTGRTITGIVVDAETKSPVASARVSEHFADFRAVTTDANGRFEFRGWAGIIGRGVLVSAKGYAGQFAPVGSDDEIEVALHRGSVSRGRVVAADGAPIEGATVVANGRHGERPPCFRTAESGPDGRFELTELHPDANYWQIVVRARGHATWAVHSPTAPETDLGDIVLGTSRAISGRVLNAEGEPVGDAAVRLDPPVRTAREEYATGVDGTFRFDDLAPGKYTLSLVAPDTAPVEREVEIPADRDVDDVVLRPAVSGMITIRALDEEGNPVPGLRVRADGVNVRPTGTMTDGRATFRGLPERKIRFDLSPSRWTRKKYAWRSTEPVVPRGQEIEVVVKEMKAIRGLVLDPDGKPVAGVAVLAVEPESRMHMMFAMTDAEGKFELWLPPGMKADLVCDGIRGNPMSGEGGEHLPIHGELKGLAAPVEGLTLKVERLRTDLAIRVRVLDTDGAPAEGFAVTVRTRSGTVDAATGADGRAVLEGLREQEYTLYAWKQDLPEDCVRPQPVKTRPGGDEVVMRCTRGTILEGVVLDADGRPVSGARASTHRADWRLDSAITDADGRFRLKALPGEAHMVFVRSAGKQARREAVVPGEGPIEIRLPR